MKDPIDQSINELYRKIPREQPSGMTDARIKNMARKHILPKPAFRVQNWQWLSVAAVMVLSVGVVLRVIQQEPSAPAFDELLEETASISVQQSSKAEKPRAEKESVGTKALSSPVQGMMAPSPARLEKKQKFLPMEDAVSPANRVAPQAEAMYQQDKDALAESPCGQHDLQEVEDRQLWQARIEQLYHQGKNDQAQCLEQLMQQMPE